MSNRYRVLLPLLVNGEHGQFDEFDYEFSPADEYENVKSGLLAIVPREYRVVAEDSVVYDTPTGGTFKAALLIEHEAALIGAGTIERVEPAPKKQAKEVKQ